MEFDLNASAAARAEMEKEERVIWFGDPPVRFELAARELPYDFFQLPDDDALNVLFGEHADEFRALRPTINDLQDVLLKVVEWYGLGSLGELLASSGSSKNGSKPSRRTSKRTTA